MTNTINLRKSLPAAFLLPMLLIAAMALASTQARAALPVSDDMPTLAPIIDKAETAVVNISTRGHVEMQQNPLFNDPFFRRFFDIPEMPQQRETTSLGSGVIIDADEGLIITNNHVIAKADKVTVTTFNGREFEAEIVGTDARTDLALLKINADGLDELPLADSDEVRVGDFVIAIGNPFGLAHTVTSGIVSAKGRGGLRAENYEDFIQTDASINPGNSGGALIDLKGRLVGVNTAILSRSGGNIGIGFAIPVNMVKAVVGQLQQFGEVRRGVLGVHVQPVTPQLAKAFGLENTNGALVASVVPNSAAEEAGIKPGDVIVSANGRKVREYTDLRNIIGLLRVGEEVRMELVSDGERRVVEATTKDPDETAQEFSGLHPALEGATFAELDDRSPLFGEVEGVLVTDVERGTPAATAGGIGLRPGDVIVSVNRQEIENLDEFRELVKESEGMLLLNIRRGNGSLFIAVQG